MTTTIKLEKETKEKLERFGHKGESYDEIIERLIDYFEELNMEELIEARWERLQREKKHYISLEDV